MSQTKNIKRYSSHLHKLLTFFVKCIQQIIKKYIREAGKND